MFLVQLLLLCIAVSFDGLGAGFSYGARNLRIPPLSLLIISLSSAFTMALAMFLGWTLGQCISWDFSRLLGGGILICLGCWVVWQELGKDKELPKNESNRPEILITEEVRERKKRSKPGFLYFFKKILIEPQEADLDNSGTINSKEAFFLGLALASDAFGAGIGVALTGFNPWVTSFMVGVSKFFLISLGLFWGHLSREKISLFPAHFLAGGLLILLGVFNIL